LPVHLIAKGDGYYKLKNVNSGLFLAVGGDKSIHGTKFCQWSETEENGQLFSIEEKELVVAEDIIIIPICT
jgi:Ricin-type beta-trefoil lectin domain-like